MTAQISEILPLSWAKYSWIRLRLRGDPSRHLAPAGRWNKPTLSATPRFGIDHRIAAVGDG
jgi:hypothetical protein